MNPGAVPDPQTLAHHVAIQQLLYTHSRGVDRADADTLKACYWPDAEVAYGSYNGPAHPFCEALPQGIRKYAATQHTVTNTLIDIRGDTALSESCVTAYHYLQVEDGQDQEMTYIGRYVDHLQCREQTWKIAFRRVVMDWNQNTAASAILEGPPFAGLAKGGRAPHDPLYEMQKSVFEA